MGTDDFSQFSLGDTGYECQGGDLNSRPRAYESPALPLSYPGERFAAEDLTFHISARKASRLLANIHWYNKSVTWCSIDLLVAELLE